MTNGYCNCCWNKLARTMRREAVCMECDELGHKQTDHVGTAAELE